MYVLRKHFSFRISRLEEDFPSFQILKLCFASNRCFRSRCVFDCLQDRREEIQKRIPIRYFLDEYS